ncbi:MAG: tetratricopeptide repeat protein [Anaerolineaceae bacterium]|jgi:tetratricopeptide (TPR) repeat protein
MYIHERKDLFRKSSNHSNPYRIMLLLLVIAGLVAVVRSYARGEIYPPLIPTPTPTRTVNSYKVEAETLFTAGNLDKAIEAYRKAILLEPQNTDLMTNLARIQVYSANTLTTDDERRNRLKEALDLMDKAREINPNDSMVRAIRGFVLNYYANPDLAGGESKARQSEAESEVLKALQLDQKNVLAKAFYVEILADQYKLPLAQEYMAQAMEQGPELMDVHRVQAYLHETLQQYPLAIEEYKKAIEITPNLTFLYNSIGRTYRYLQDYEIALEYFAKAASLNEQLGIKDPIPYMAIANTYLRMGEAMAASRNAYKALSMNPYNVDTYGQVGVIYYRARNYEGSIPLLQCAVRGCDAETSCEARECDDANNPAIPITPLPLTGTTVHYFYTYGSVLAALHRPGDDKCERAYDVFNEIRSQFLSDEIIISIVEIGEEICRSTDNLPAPTNEPASIEIPAPAATPIP